MACADHHPGVVALVIVQLTTSAKSPLHMTSGVTFLGALVDTVPTATLPVKAILDAIFGSSGLQSTQAKVRTAAVDATLLCYKRIGPALLTALRSSGVTTAVQGEVETKSKSITVEPHQAKAASSAGGGGRVAAAGGLDLGIEPVDMSSIAEGVFELLNVCVAVGIAPPTC